MNKNRFFEISAQQFAFLTTEYGFRHRARKTSGGTWLDIYQSQTAAVEVALEWQEQYVYVEICRLVDGEIKENPYIVRSGSELNCFNLENLLLLRAPGLLATQQDDVEKTLADYAQAIQEHASDVLQGDFAVFSQLEEMVQERAEKANSNQRVSPVYGKTNGTERRSRPTLPEPAVQVPQRSRR